MINAHDFINNNVKEKNAITTNNGLEVLVIPVVVHVIYDSNDHKISESSVISQITVFNEDFGNYGPLDNDPRAVDTRIRFCLAKKDPAGNTTNGIDWIQSTFSDLDVHNEMLTKNLSRWNQQRYFNIWIVHSISDNSTPGTIQGYSYLPSQTGGGIFSGDGLALVYKFTGRYNPLSPLSYNLGRTGVHETGHYLDLLHP
ncbi:MAG: M43 family zinc metalloprotease, partial [Bacteroidia bacterium]|nr:M43 family zinc metalloprotease [Bacteroidia bacterium]